MVDRGDLAWINFNPQKGREQAGHRPALVLTKRDFHENCSNAIVMPITSNTSPWPWKVMLPDNDEIKGAILVDQIRMIDRNARKLKTFGKLDNETLLKVQTKLELLLIQ